MRFDLKNKRVPSFSSFIVTCNTRSSFKVAIASHIRVSNSIKIYAISLQIASLILLVIVGIDTCWLCANCNDTKLHIDWSNREIHLISTAHAVVGKNVPTGCLNQPSYFAISVRSSACCDCPDAVSRRTILRIAWNLLIR